MEFFPTVSLKPTLGEARVWNALKEALRHEEGYAYLRYPIFPSGSARRYEPDILLLHRQWGLVVIEVKGCRAEQVEALDGQAWHMRDWYEDEISPYEQADRQMWALKKHFDRYPELRTFPGVALVALPEVHEDEWRERGFTELPCNPGILHANQLTPARLRARLTALADARPFSDEAWRLACQVLGLRPVMEETRALRSPDVGHGLLDLIRQSEAAIPALDLEQQRIGFEIPPGPQRIRGIAGSGKTMLLAMKAARMHLSEPEWDIAFTFSTKSLYQVVREAIARFCLHFGGCEPNWEKLRVVHSWGLYKQLAQQSGQPARNLDWAKGRHGQGTPAELFSVVCQDLLELGVSESLDAILIDEGQDFLPEFYQLAHQALRAPKRLLWAYDEAQSLDHLKIPDAETLFGRDPDGKLKVDLTGSYPGGLHKSRIMRRCYRTPARILVPAHAFGMGLLREGGPVQMITTKQGWHDIGYQVLEGSFDAPGREVVITRPLTHCPHPLDAAIDKPLLKSRPFSRRTEELEDCAEHIDYLREQGVSLDEVLVVLLGGPFDQRQVEADMAALADALATRNIPVHLANKANASVFRRPGAVTLSGVPRAKGHEAPYVFVLGLDRLAANESKLQHRNQLFVSLTRSRAYCRLSGLTPAADALFTELRRVVEAGDRLHFTTPDPKQLQMERTEVSEEPEEEKILPFVRHLPLYADLRAVAGTPGLRVHMEDGEREWVPVDTLDTLNERMFVIRIEGDSMEPRLPDGALAVFQWTDDLPVGKIVLVKVADEATPDGFSLLVKRLAIADRGAGLQEYRLESLNPSYPPRRIERLGSEHVEVKAIYKGLAAPTLFTSLT